MKKSAACFCFLLFVIACGTAVTPVPVADPPPTVMDLEDITTELPNFPGSAEFNSNCRVCHSLRYITMQPEFPRATWKKTVDKMIHNYGAPIPDSTRDKIVDFLMSVKGKGE
jgi:hypothetical protein